MTRTTNVFQNQEELDKYFNKDFQTYLKNFSKLKSEEYEKSQKTFSTEDALKNI
jgi:hypothetical protein